MAETARRGRRLAERGVRVALVVAAVTLGGVACRSKPETTPPPAETQLSPVDAPADLLAEGSVATPDAILQRLERGIGGGAGLLPATLGGIVCAGAGLDARLAAEINGASPAYIVFAGDPASPSWALAARLVEARRARPLYEGASAVFDAVDAGAGVVLLADRRAGHAQPGAPQSQVVGIAPGGWVVVASSSSALAALAPYATRTVPTRAPVRESIALDVPRSALSGALAAAVERAWTGAERAMLEDDRALRAEHGGRAPDFGDPRAIVSALDGWTQRKVAVLRDLRGAHVGVDVADDGLTASVTALPASADGAASAMLAALPSGDGAPLGRLPRTTALGVLARDDAAGRAKDAADLEAALDAMLGSRLSAPDAKRVHAAFDDWSAAHGDWMTLALALVPSGIGVVADVPSSDPARTSRAVREALDLVAQVPAIHQPAASWLHARDVTFRAADVPGGGRATVATLVRDGAAPGATSSPVVAPSAALAWAAGDGDVKLALGTAPLPLLSPPLPGETLADDPAMRPLLGSLGDVAGAVVAQPGRSPGCAATGGIAVAWGARPDGAGRLALHATLAASDSSLRCLARSLF